LCCAEKFEALGADVFARTAAPLAELLRVANVTVAQLSAVELIGGATRIPRVQAALSAALGGRALDKHLDADETVALGAGLVAANLSTIFRMRKYGAADAAPFAIELAREGGGGADGGAGDDSGDGEGADASTLTTTATASTASAPKLLIPRFKRLPARRVVTYANVTGDFAVTARYAGGAAPLPPAAADSGDLVASWGVGGVAASRAAHNATGKVTLGFVMGRDGVLTLERAEMQVEVIDWIEEIVPINATNATNATGANATLPASNATASAGGVNGTNGTGVNGTVVPPPPPAVLRIKKPRLRMSRVALEVRLTGAAVPPLSAEARAASLAKLAGVAAADAARTATAEAKSTLEAYILRTRDALEADAEDSALHAVTTAAQRTSFLAALSEAEEWLYGDGEEGDAAAFRARSAALTAVGDAMELRAAELTRRPAAAAKARKFAADTRAAVGAWADTKPHINATEKEGLLAKVEALEAWLAEAEARQAKTAAHEAPAFLAADVAKEMKPVDAAAAKLRKKPVPKPPKAPRVGNATNATNATAAEDGGAGGDVGVPKGDGSDYEGAGAGGAGAGAGGAEEGGDAEGGAGEELPAHDELR
jgi:hypoxia up-regulated 1